MNPQSAIGNLQSSDLLEVHDALRAVPNCELPVEQRARIHDIPPVRIQRQNAAPNVHWSGIAHRRAMMRMPHENNPRIPARQRRRRAKKILRGVLRRANQLIVHAARVADDEPVLQRGKKLNRLRVQIQIRAFRECGNDFLFVIAVHAVCAPAIQRVHARVGLVGTINEVAEKNERVDFIFSTRIQRARQQIHVSVRVGDECDAIIIFQQVFSLCKT